MLKHLTGKQTKLKSFHIDISGCAPEIGDELDDLLYLNPNGCNRQFILLSTDQKTAPLLNAKFSTSRGMRWRGKLVNSVYSVDDPKRLFQIRQVEIEADTAEAHVEDARVLRGKVDQFRNRDDAWWDDVLIADMIELAKKTGDITRNPVTLEAARFRQDNFHTSYFGGMYIFRDVRTPTAIAVDDLQALGELPVENTLGFEDRNGIATFLEDSDLVESIVSARNLNAGALLKQRLDFILVDTAASVGEDLTACHAMNSGARRGGI